ncbi:MAG: family ATPase [Moraxellaceae bacterium]|jgi:predicted AAA+ superfamily ATPase|nr:family ATPase [Moraxellaceae bacterium]
MNESAALISELQHLIATLEGALPRPAPAPDFKRGLAFRWRRRAQGDGYLETVRDLSPIRLDDLMNIDRQKAEIRRNTGQFVRGLPANNVLLTGSRGTGKSSLVKALLNEFAADGLRVVEVDRHLLADLPDIVEQLCARPERFIVYCDDLSFSEDDASYRALKTTLDGSLHAGADNVIIYATSNRRHLLPEFHAENQQAHFVANGEIHPGEAVDDKISLSDRFGLWLTFYPNSQDDYLAAVALWLGKHGQALDEDSRLAALQWALARGNRSSRTASQFARDWAGQRGLASR